LVRATLVTAAGCPYKFISLVVEDLNRRGAHPEELEGIVYELHAEGIKVLAVTQ
jgi:hypothetical protein